MSEGASSIKRKKKLKEKILKHCFWEASIILGFPLFARKARDYSYHFKCGYKQIKYFFYDSHQILLYLFTSLRRVLFVVGILNLC